jgi:sugar phosphate permease
MRRMRWTAFTLAVLAFVLSFFHRMAPAAIAGELRETFQVGSAALGTLAATYFYVYTVMQIPTGIMADTYGPRRLMTFGGVMGGLGSILFGLAPNFEVAAIGRTVIGFGVSLIFISMLKLNANWFKDREFATITGLCILVGNLGAASSATPLAWAVSMTSWRNVFVGVGVFSLFLGLMTWFLVRNNPKEAGLPSMRELEGKQAHATMQQHWWPSLLAVMKNRASWPGFWVNFGTCGAYFAFVGLWAVPFLMEVHGMPRNMAAHHTTLMLLGFAFAALLFGTLSDRMGRRKPLLIALAMLFSLCWLPMLLGLQLSAIAWLALFTVMGVGASGFTLTWACAKEVNPPALSGMATSLVNTGAFLAAGIFQPIVGWIIDRRGIGVAHTLGDYQLGLGFLFAMSLIGVAGALLTKETYCHYIHMLEERHEA